MHSKENATRMADEFSQRIVACDHLAGRPYQSSVIARLGLLNTSVPEFCDLLIYVMRGAALASSPLHGIKHWACVFQNAMRVDEHAGLTNAYKDEPVMLTFGSRRNEPFNFTLVALLFALFHDCRRAHEGPCMVHGAMGAVLLSRLAREFIPPSFTVEVDAAIAACMLHTVVDRPRMEPGYTSLQGLTLSQPFNHPAQIHAVGMCLDADRYDLIRLGMVADLNYLWHVEAYQAIMREDGL